MLLVSNYISNYKNNGYFNKKVISNIAEINRVDNREIEKKLKGSCGFHYR